jgi:hypothetical protein
LNKHIKDFAKKIVKHFILAKNILKFFILLMPKDMCKDWALSLTLKVGEVLKDYF